eukprot:11962-Chlamydomonas_euryale.AAC.1
MGKDGDDGGVRRSLQTYCKEKTSSRVRALGGGGWGIRAGVSVEVLLAEQEMLHGTVSPPQVASIHTVQEARKRAKYEELLPLPHNKEPAKVLAGGSCAEGERTPGLGVTQSTAINAYANTRHSTASHEKSRPQAGTGRKRPPASLSFHTSPADVQTQQTAPAPTPLFSHLSRRRADTANSPRPHSSLPTLLPT